MTGADPRLVVGLMTGTSVDGLDIAVCRLPRGIPRSVEIIGSASEPMPADLRRELLLGPELTVQAAARLSHELGHWYATAVADLCHRLAVQPHVVGMHGQTVYHEHGVTTLQIGEPSYLALKLGCPVVSDFRQMDIAAGGCGAPLVPMVDSWLLGRPDQGVIALNIGGITNITAIPPQIGDAPVLGFDCGPGNMILDELARRFTQGVANADMNGDFARQGSTRPDWLAFILEHPFLALRPPRSAGREQFGRDYVDQLIERFAPESGEDWFDLFATVSEATARAVSDAVRRFVPEHYDARELVVAGGGARNPVLMEHLARMLGDMQVLTSEERGLPVDLKEAIAFAVLASARVDGIPTNCIAVTGARLPVLLGKITEALPSGAAGMTAALGGLPAGLSRL